MSSIFIYFLVKKRLKHIAEQFCLFGYCSDKGNFAAFCYKIDNCYVPVWFLFYSEINCFDKFDLLNFSF